MKRTFWDGILWAVGEWLHRACGEPRWLFKLDGHYLGRARLINRLNRHVVMSDSNRYREEAR